MVRLETLFRALLDAPDRGISLLSLEDESVGVLPLPSPDPSVFPCPSEVMVPTNFKDEETIICMSLLDIEPPIHADDPLTTSTTH